MHLSCEARRPVRSRILNHQQLPSRRKPSFDLCQEIRKTRHDNEHTLREYEVIASSGQIVGVAAVTSEVDRLSQVPSLCLIARPSQDCRLRIDSHHAGTLESEETGHATISTTYLQDSLPCKLGFVPDHPTDCGRPYSRSPLNEIRQFRLLAQACLLDSRRCRARSKHSVPCRVGMDVSVTQQFSNSGTLPFLSPQRFQNLTSPTRNPSP